jgi:tRNA dimethylallyltransferase
MAEGLDRGLNMAPEGGTAIASLEGILFLAGPTAVGKSSAALALAEKLDAEIISADSMQVYRGMDIGTAKPSLADRSRVKHHLIDVADVTDPFDAAAWVKMARAASEDIRRRGLKAIVCGGTGLYMKAFLEGLGEAPASDRAVRRELEQTPHSELLMELQQKDPEMYERIDRKNPRRVVRAVEVCRLSGRAYSTQRAAWLGVKRGLDSGPLPGTAGPLRFALDRDRADLRQRLDSRVESMFQGGLVEETSRLLDQGLARNRTAMQAIGYRQVIEHLRGERSLQETITLVKHRTWQFAKRQLNWFRNQMAFEWVQLAPAESPDGIADRLARMIQGRHPAGCRT